MKPLTFLVIMIVCFELYIVLPTWAMFVIPIVAIVWMVWLIKHTPVSRNDEDG